MATRMPPNLFEGLRRRGHCGLCDRVDAVRVEQRRRGRVGARGGARPAQAVLGVAELLLDNGELVRATELADRTLTEISRHPTGDEEYDAYIRGSALLIRGLARSEGGDDAGAAARQAGNQYSNCVRAPHR